MAHIFHSTDACMHRAGRSGSAFSTFFLAFGVWRERRALARLSDTQLSDIGVSRAQAKAEAKRPIWDVPVTWRR